MSEWGILDKLAQQDPLLKLDIAGQGQGPKMTAV